MTAPTQTTDTDAPKGDERQGSITLYHYLRAMLRDPVVMFSVVFLTALLICAVFAPWIAPHDPMQQNILGGQRQPLWSEVSIRGQAKFFILGTDELGRDVFSRLIYGARVSVAVALVGVIVSGALGVTLGLLAGFHGGRLDDLIMRAVDGFMAIHRC